MGDFSKNFSSKEFECPHCHKVHIDPLLVITLQRMRDIIAMPINITSGYRCDVHNKAVGGVPNSQHVQGKAADIYVDGWGKDQFLNVVKQLTMSKNIYVGYAYAIKNSTRAIHIDIRIPESETVRRWQK